MQVQPYLFFDGHCEEAAAFYKKTIGAEVVSLHRFSESPDAHPPGMLPPGSETKVMHMELRIGSTTVFASDGHCTGKTNFQGFSLTISVTDPAEADRVFNALSEGGQIRMPLGKTFFSPKFGMLADKFGLGWMVIVTP